VDSQKSGTNAKLQRRALATGIAASRKKAEKRNKRREAGAPTMEEHTLAHIVFDNMMDDLHVNP
jgi:hypothetical protein